jgi:hypothetical protein
MILFLDGGHLHQSPPYSRPFVFFACRNALAEDTDPVLLALSAARPSLRKVQLFGCANATDRGVVALIQSCGHKITGAAPHRFLSLEPIRLMFCAAMTRSRPA